MPKTKKPKKMATLKKIPVREREILNLTLHISELMGDHSQFILNTIRPWFDQYLTVEDTIIETIELPTFDRDICLSLNPREGKVAGLNFKKKSVINNKHGFQDSLPSSDSAVPVHPTDHDAA